MKFCFLLMCVLQIILHYGSVMYFFANEIVNWCPLSNSSTISIDDKINVREFIQPFNYRFDSPHDDDCLSHSPLSCNKGISYIPQNVKKFANLAAETDRLHYLMVVLEDLSCVDTSTGTISAHEDLMWDEETRYSVWKNILFPFRYVPYTGIWWILPPPQWNDWQNKYLSGHLLLWTS